LPNVLAFALGVDGEGPSAPSRIVLNEWSQSKGKKNILATTTSPHILRQGKTSCYKEKARLVETQLATIGDGMKYERMHEQVVTLLPSGSSSGTNCSRSSFTQHSTWTLGNSSMPQKM